MRKVERANISRMEWPERPLFSWMHSKPMQACRAGGAWWWRVLGGKVAGLGLGRVVGSSHGVPATGLIGDSGL